MEENFPQMPKELFISEESYNVVINLVLNNPTDMIIIGKYYLGDLYFYLGMTNIVIPTKNCIYFNNNWSNH